ncbi:NTP transferase domain-containing protein [Sphingomonas sp.]|uniref:NTP transferase domain-containing protein n=1 Tax=Sphingomonas sp. TaxID=28214 RepID=UPI003B3BC330
MRAAIILAAGASRRFGRQDKLRARLQGRPLLDHVIEHARASGARPIIVVVSRRTTLEGVRQVRAWKARDGLSVTLAAGFKALRPIDREVLIFLGDMPFAAAPPMRLKPGIDAVRPWCSGMPGHPMLVRTRAAREALTSGDRGLAGKLRTAAVRGGPASILDVDTQRILRRARYHGSRGAAPRCKEALKTGR